MLTSDADSVIPASEGLDQPPAVEEREIVDVDLEHADDSRTMVTHKACQHCGDGVDLLESHAAACLWVEDSIGRIMYKPVFCDQACWLDWMRQDRGEES